AAASTTSSCSFGTSSSSITLRARSACMAIRPPSSDLGLRRPRTTFASVTVGRVPPRPYAAGPGYAGAHRSHFEQTARVDPCDAAAARADRVDVHDACAHRETGHLAQILLRRLAVADQR